VGNIALEKKCDGDRMILNAKSAEIFFFCVFRVEKNMIRIYNTLTKTKEEFKPIEPGKVGIYLCGPTVYKPSHIGHMVGPVIFDAIKRYLTYSGYEVNLVINITDVDDKLIAESLVRGLPMSYFFSEKRYNERT